MNPPAQQPTAPIPEVKVLGTRLVEDIGLPWLLTIASDPEFLGHLGMSGGQFFLLLWQPMTYPQAREAYDAVVWMKDFREGQGEEALVYPAEILPMIQFVPDQTPPGVVPDEQLFHIRLRERAKAGEWKNAPVANAAGSEMTTAPPEEKQGIGPGGIIVGGFFGALALVALYKWMTRDIEEDD